METIRRNWYFILLLFVWLLFGLIPGPIVYGVVFISLVLLKLRNAYQEILIGLLYCLILSDSREKILSNFIHLKILYILLMMVILFIDRKKFQPFQHYYAIFILFFIVAAGCILNAPPETRLGSIMKTGSYFLLITLIPNYVLLCYKTDKVHFFKSLLYFCTAILLLGFLLTPVIPGVTMFQGRFRGLLGNPNGLGLFSLLFFLMYSTINYIFPEILSKREKVFFLVTIFISMYFSDSRNCILGVLIFFMFSSLYKISPVLGFIIFLSILVGYEYLEINVVNIIKAVGLQDFFRIQSISSAGGRFVAWGFAIVNIKLSFWFGKGFGYTDYLFFTNQQYLNALGHQGNAHNSFLTIWLDTGLVGLICYLGALITFIIKSARKYRLALPIFYSAIFTAIFESWLSSSLNPFTIQIFIILFLMSSDEVVRQSTAHSLYPKPLIIPQYAKPAL